MVVATSYFHEVTDPAEYRAVQRRLVHTPKNTKLEGARYLTRSAGYVTKVDVISVSAVLASDQSFARGVPTITRTGAYDMLQLSHNTAQENMLVLELNSSFAKHCLTFEHAPDGSLLAVETRAPLAMYMVPGSHCDAYVAYQDPHCPGRHRSRSGVHIYSGLHIYRVNVGDLSKVVALPNPKQSEGFSHDMPRNVQTNKHVATGARELTVPTRS